MARPCQCPGVCATSQYGAYTVLVHQAQHDTDQQRAQLAHAFLAVIGPMAGSIGADGHCPGDALAEPYLHRVYPAEPSPIAATEAETQARIAQIEREAIAEARKLLGPTQTT